MSVNKRGKTWYVKFRPFGDSIQLALKGCEGKRQAMAIEVEILHALRQKAYDGLSPLAREALVKLFANQGWEQPPELQPQKIEMPSREFSMWDAVNLYIKDESFRVLSKPSRYHEALAQIVGFFGKDRHVKDIWIPELKLYRTSRSGQGVTNATINREISALSGLFRVLVEHQIVEANPCRLLKRLNEKSSLRQVYISLEDVKRIMAQCPDWYSEMIWIAYLTGMRKGEIHKLRWRHIDLQRRIVKFHGTETKEGRPKRVPLHRELIAVIERMGKIRNLSDDRLFEVSEQSLRWPWERALNKLDWPNPRPRFHDLRHTWKTNARRSGIDSEIRETILGHSDRSLDVNERYGIIGDEELVKAIDQFSFDHGSTQIVVASHG